MQSQKARKYGTLSDSLFSVNDKVQYFAIADLLGEITEIYKGNMGKNIPSKEELSENLRKITFATSVLTFENIRFMVLEMNASKAIILNLAEDTIIVGVSKDALLSDVAHILGCISLEINY